MTAATISDRMTSLSPHVYMRCNDIIDVIVIIRHHVKDTLSANKAKMRKSENILCQCYSQTVFFDWRIIPHTHTQQLSSARKFTTLHCCNEYTSNMAAVTVVNVVT